MKKVTRFIIIITLAKQMNMKRIIARVKEKDEG